MNGDRMQVKKCAKCNEEKSVNDFEENQYSPDGRFLICKACFDQRSEKPPQITESIAENKKKKKPDGAVTAGRVEKVSVKKSPQPVRTVKPVKTKSEPENDEKQAESIRQAQLEVLSDAKEAPFHARGLLPKLRKCNGCKKIEPVGKAPAKPPRPVQAWFCEDCFKSKTHTYAGKGYLVYDYWGRIYKVSKVLDNERVRGVVKKGDGSWSTRKFNIHGRWLTKKPL
jgi:hypothetical protein